jgi:uncharacterized protein
MVKTVTIKVGDIELTAILSESKTAEAIWQALPLKAPANRWGDEIYFDIPVQQPLEDGQETVDFGDLGYYPPGNGFCIFFGPTPASRDKNEIRPAAAVNVFGRVTGNATVLKRIKDGETISVTRKTG